MSPPELWRVCPTGVDGTQSRMAVGKGRSALVLGQSGWNLPFGSEVELRLASDMCGWMGVFNVLDFSVCLSVCMSRSEERAECPALLLSSILVLLRQDLSLNLELSYLPGCPSPSHPPAPPPTAWVYKPMWPLCLFHGCWRLNDGESLCLHSKFSFPLSSLPSLFF